MKAVIINEELFELEDQCHQLVQTIVTSKMMEQYLKTKKEMETSINVNQLKNDFIASRQAFEEISPYGKYIPEFREKQRTVRQAKRQFDLNEEVAAFRISETELQKILDSIGKQLAHTISTEIKISAGSPFLKKVKGAEETAMDIENKEFEQTHRRGLVVWVYSLKQLKNLRKFGLVHYVSRKMKYVIMYLNEDNYEQTEERIKKLHFVRNVERSYRPDIEMNFAEKIGKKADTKEEGFEIEELNTKIRLADHVF